MTLPNELLSKITRKKKNLPVEEQFYYLHDFLMQEYGWIPLEEYKALPITTVDTLAKIIVERREKEQKAMKKRRKR